MSGELRIAELAPADHARWDAFVERAGEGTFFHLAGWSEVIRRAFGHRTHYLYAERDGAIVGVLPLGEVRSRLFGHALISVPFCVYGGVLAADEAARSALEAAAMERAERLGVGYLELRNRRPVHDDWLRKSLYVTFRKTIDPDPEANLKAIPRKQRAMVRKGIKAGLLGELSGEVDTLYELYSESVRNLGTPVFPRRYFGILREVFADRSDVLLVRHGARPVAGVLNFYFRDEVLPYYGGGTAAARDLKANDFMYWELMRRCAERGIRVFDYGRSKVDSGSYHFKKNWGFEPEPLAYEYHLVRSRDLPDISPVNPKYRLFIAAWKRLPLPLSRVLGPWIARNLG